MCPKFRIGGWHIIQIQLSESCIFLVCQLLGLFLKWCSPTRKRKQLFVLAVSTSLLPLPQIQFTRFLPQHYPKLFLLGSAVTSSLLLLRKSVGRINLPPHSQDCWLFPFPWSWLLPLSSVSFLVFHWTLGIGCPEAHPISFTWFIPILMAQIYSSQIYTFNPDIIPKLQTDIPKYLFDVSTLVSNKHLNIVRPKLSDFFCLPLLFPVLKPC